MKSSLEKIPLVFNVYKPAGPSSFNSVHYFKRNLNFDFGKIGHFGTLDPFAEGVLLIGVQGAQRLNNLVHEFLPKTYRAYGVFGKKTETGDNTKAPIEEKDIDLDFQSMSKEVLEELFREEFLGEYWQAPHMVSAARHNGKRLYQLYKEGKFVERDKKKREILDFKVISYDYPYLVFEAQVSSGTYIRSLFEEMSELLGGVGHLDRLVRTKIGQFSEANALVSEHWPKKGEEFDLSLHATPIDQILVLNKIFLDEEQTKLYVFGLRLAVDRLHIQQVLDFDNLVSEEMFWVYSDQGVLLGLVKACGAEIQVIFNLNFYTLGFQT